MTSSDDILSQEESDALLAESVPAPASGIRDIDLSLWEQVALDRIPAFEAINDDVAEAIDAVWSNLCKRAIHTSPQDARQLPWRTYARELQAPMSINLLDIASLGQPGLIVLRQDTVYAMVDLFFGGNGHGGRDPQLSQLTQMETRLAQRFCQMLAPLMQDAWKLHVAVEFKANDTIFDPDTTYVASPSESVVVAKFGFDIRDATHVIDVVLPSRLIGLLKSQRFSNAPAGKQVTTWNDKITADLRAARIDLRAMLGELQLTLSDIVNARPGDIFMSESLTRVRVLAGDKPILEGTLGAHQGHHAVKVRKLMPRNYLGDING